MAFFRKKLAQQEVVGILFQVFQSRFEIFHAKLYRSVSAISGGKADQFLDNEEYHDRAIDLWTLCAAKLSQLKQGGEAAEMTRVLLNFYQSSNEEYDRLTLLMSDIIVTSFQNDDNLFHNVSCEIFSKAYPGLADYISPYGSGISDKCVIDGIELASCLRAVDFILKDHKLAR